jgi:hypothetical protein
MQTLSDWILGDLKRAELHEPGASSPQVDDDEDDHERQPVPVGAAGDDEVAGG